MENVYWMVGNDMGISFFLLKKKKMEIGLLHIARQSGMWHYWIQRQWIGKYL